MKNKTAKLRSWQLAFIYTAVWLIISAGVRYIADILLGSLLLHIVYVMMILPSATFAAAFYFTRVCGLKPWLPVYLAVTSLILYILFGFSELNPNFLVTVFISAFFGFGLGNIFKDEAKVAVQENTDNEKKRMREKAEREYTPILNSKNKNVHKKRG